MNLYHFFFSPPLDAHDPRNVSYSSENYLSFCFSLESQLWHVTPECFTRVFPPERLVYLSPDSPNVLTEYSQDDVYILGALIDKRIPKK